MVTNTLKIHGSVSRGGAPVEGAYLSLIQPPDEFIAERRTGPDGTYEFHTTPGDWVVVCRAAGSEPAKQAVSAEAGEHETHFEL